MQFSNRKEATTSNSMMSRERGKLPEEPGGEVETQKRFEQSLNSIHQKLRQLR